MKSGISQEPLPAKDLRANYRTMIGCFGEFFPYRYLEEHSGIVEGRVLFVRALVQKSPHQGKVLYMVNAPVILYRYKLRFEIIPCAESFQESLEPSS